MSITINLDIIMTKRKTSFKNLSKEINITNSNLSVLKNNKAKAIRFCTLNELCKALNCQPDDLIEYVND